MKKVSNKYVNFGIAFALLGILVFSLVMTPLEGFEVEKEDSKKSNNDGSKKKKDIMSEVDKLSKIVSELTTKKESFEGDKLKETLSQLQHLAHLVKKDKNEKSEPI
jgi:hypothetical protein